jgi:hypothetical protein
VRILDRLPIADEPSLLFPGIEPIAVKRYQIAVWVSINDVLRPFPAVLDTGLSHNFSITESQLRTMAGLSSTALTCIGTTRLGGESLRQYRADLRIHRNHPGTMNLATGTWLLTTDEGISLVPEGSIRLPILGLRALVRSNLRLTVDGSRRQVSLRTRGWF